MGATGRCPFSRGLWIWSVWVTGFLAHVCMAVPPSVTVPAFVWSDQPLINGENGVDYEMLSQESFAQILFRGLLDLDTSKSSHSSPHWPFVKSSAAGHPEVIFAAIGDQLNGGILTQSERSDAGGASLSTIKSWLSTATSSITIPYIDVRSRRTSLASTVLTSFKQSVKDAGKVGKVVALGECKLHDADVINMSSLQELKNFLQSKPIREKVCEIVLVLLCGKDKELGAEASKGPSVMPPPGPAETGSEAAGPKRRGSGGAWDKEDARQRKCGRSWRPWKREEGGGGGSWRPWEREEGGSGGSWRPWEREKGPGKGKMAQAIRARGGFCVGGGPARRFAVAPETTACGNWRRRFVEAAGKGKRARRFAKKGGSRGGLPGLVLILILIAGIWCMSAIDTPGRFEAPKES
ncbi:hypothetical protein CBR_g26202 [Chara braunii]|uniref:Uncharacterized protein n=1 Tax=Chara braunii TaxID=69332 RepID=A0A388L788_CHABU|nr:hypothetical protein CBR_g26202 [Chara braunii]|eukprot:GBG78169.1 hypothetical protein CBR_g26202 [Chara braunii]